MRSATPVVLTGEAQAESTGLRRDGRMIGVIEASLDQTRAEAKFTRNWGRAALTVAGPIPLLRRPPRGAVARLLLVP